MKLIYPARVTHDEDKNAYIVTIPDIDCAVEAATISGAITKAVNSASAILMRELENGNPIPDPSPIDYLEPDEGGFWTVLMMDMDAYAAKTGSCQVKKSMSIPRWLNSFAESRKIDYSELVSRVLTNLYEEQYRPEASLRGRRPLQIDFRR